MKEEHIKKQIETLLSDKKVAKQYFKKAYNYDDLNEDFKQWYKEFKSKTYEEQRVMFKLRGKENVLFTNFVENMVATKGITKNPFKRISIAMKETKKTKKELYGDK